MADAPVAITASDRLARLVGRLEEVQGFADVVAALAAGHAATLDGVWGSSCALVAAALGRHAPGPIVLVAAHPGEVDDLADDLRLFTDRSIARFPAWQQLPSERLERDEIYGERQRLLKQLPADPPAYLVTSIQALLQPVVSRETLARRTRTIGRGQRLDLEELSRWLVEAGFQAMSTVELPGEFSVHGGIVDILAVDWTSPVRIELFGDEVDSIRRFDPASQRSLERLEAIDITLLDPADDDLAHLTAHLPASSWFLLIEPADLDAEGRHWLSRIDDLSRLHTVDAVLREIYRFPSVTAEGVAASSFETACQLQIESVERFSGEVGRVRDELDSAAAGHEVLVVCQTEAEVQRLEEIFADSRLVREGRLHLPVGDLSAGFRFVPARTVVLSSRELFRRSERGRTTQRRWGRVIDTFLDLREGDFVVHVTHGIARYRGLHLLEKEGQREEHLLLEFAGGTKLYVPSSKIGLVQKYVGGSKARPALARLGGRTWIRQKERAQQAVIDMASDLLELQASRQLRPGIAFRQDSDWQHEFDASFPFDETADQLAAIADIKGDMHQPRPMDRLLCGDVGYGKTEVAMRAAFKAVDAGYQVAVLVPTTVLAEQHHRTFVSRMAEYPFSMARLSRFLTRKQQNEVLAQLAAGAVDIVIGTHRLAQPDVQFHNLGLVIIDEEQRFGVEVKERLKALRRTVDVLTMTATPIPRTLHMSLLGLRDISNLQTPPEDRLAVETRVARFAPELVRQAVLRELNREGQIFFVHNRVHDIDVVARRLSQIVPEATLGIAHGQMPEHELEAVMLDFVQHRFDILLATTIIESGLDIPNANTIFIDQADRYGLADLHQMRGRVGRYKHRAYCYLLLDPNQSLSPNAAKRLRAIEEFSDIGAGFAIAMRDLEIRGAGNILGTEQSGHIAAVGYELYCELLEQTVRQLRKLPPKEMVDVNLDLPGEAFLPRSYISDMRTKIDLYRRLGRLVTIEELDDFAAELVDRFGQRPPQVDRMLAQARLRILAHQWQIDSIRIEDGYAVFGYRRAAWIRRLVEATGGRLRVVDARSAYLPLGKAVNDLDATQQAIELVLQPG